MRSVISRDIEPRYLVRPGPSDHQVLERLLTPNLWQPDPINLDGVVLDASHAERFRPCREKLSAQAQVIVDHQVYRLQHPSCVEVSSLVALPYGRQDREYAVSDFRDTSSVRSFVQAVLDFQHDLKVTDYLAPAFFVDSKDSAWRDVNDDLLKESIRQVGGQVYATVCGSLSASSDSSLIASVTNSGAVGVYMLISPLAALRDPVAKLVEYTKLLEAFQGAGLSVVSARQPAFGLALLALGIAGFDGGIAQAEQFNYPNMVRRRPGLKRGQTRKRSSRGVYISNIMTNVPLSAARYIFSTQGLRGLFPCDEVCCRTGMTKASLHNREHFLWSRTREVARLREVHQPWRVRHYLNRVSQAHQLADKLREMMPDEPLRFTHLDTWSRAVEAFAAALQPRRS